MKQIKLKPNEKKVVKAIANAAIPEGGELDISPSDVDLFPAVEKLLNGLEGEYRFGMRMLLKFFDYMPFIAIFKFKKFTNLPLEDQIRVLKKWNKSGSYYFRALYLAVTSVAFMGYYTDDKVRDALGYDSHKSGIETV